MKNRNFVSLSIAIAFVAISATGLLLYFGIKADAVEIVHVLFGLLFIGFVVFHIRYNFSALKNYAKDRKTRTVRKELVAACFVSTALLITMCQGFSFMEDLAHAGRNLLGKNKRYDGSHEGAIFSEISTNDKVNGARFHLIIRLREGVIAPVIAIWIEDSVEKYVQNVFVPAKKLELPSSTTRIDDKGRAENNNLLHYSDFQATLLPEFNKRSPDRNPNYGKSTPLNNFILETNVHVYNNFTLYLEIRNKDKTELYHSAIDTAKSDVFSLNSLKNEFIREGIVRINAHQAPSSPK